MIRIVVNDDLQTTLGSTIDPVELCDPTGKVLGRFFPLVPSSRISPLEPQVSEEELDRRDRSNERRYTTAEVLRYLESL
jgi:hypothetical protein